MGRKDLPWILVKKNKTMKDKIFNFNQFVLNENRLDETCPLATRDLEVNTENRDVAIKSKTIKYGPINLSDEKYWEELADHWNTDVDVAKNSKCGNCTAFDISPKMKECMPGEVDKFGILGFCWMHDFKCHSERTCYTWAAGGPIDDDETSKSWSENKKKKQE
jgi:hypothetical protein